MIIKRSTIIPYILKYVAYIIIALSNISMIYSQMIFS